MDTNQLTGNVINIQKFTVHDGPGIRTEVFLKGCPLRCKWCSNPESMSRHSEVGVFCKDCIGVDQCGWCLKACPKQALIVKDNRVVRIDRTRCINCTACSKACPNDTLKCFGTKMTVAEVLKLVRDDRFFYDRSNGGVTISGGDALVQWEFTLELLKRCKHCGIRTCVESELFCEQRIIDEILPYTDLVISDLKHMDSEKHREFTGVPNEPILRNLKHVAMSNTPLVLRIPVVPGHNDSRENIEATAEFIVNELHNNVSQVQLLPYRLLGLEKYEALGQEYPMKDEPAPQKEVYIKAIRELAGEYQALGIPAVAGTTVKIKG